MIGAPSRGAELIPDQKIARSHQAAVGFPAELIVEPAIRAQRRNAIEAEGAAVNFIRARSRDHLDLRHAAAELGVDGSRADAEFGHQVDSAHGGRVAAAPAAVVAALLDIDAVERHILRLRSDAVEVVSDHPGLQGDQRAGVEVLQRQILNTLQRDHVADRAVDRLDGAAARFDGHSLRCLAYFQLQVDSGERKRRRLRKISTVFGVSTCRAGPPLYTRNCAKRPTA